MDTDAFGWQLDIMFSIGNNTIHKISNWIQVAGAYRPTVVLDRIHTSFFHSWDFIAFANRPDEILVVTFMLALEIKFERALHLCSEGYETSDDYGLP